MSSWEKNFPADVDSPDNAKHFLARMNYIAIASMLVHRGVIPKNIVKKRSCKDVMFYVFDKATPVGEKLHGMMTGIRDGILKQYVREVQVVFGRSAEHPDDIIEMFSIKFTYDDQDALELSDGAGRMLMRLAYRGMAAFKQQVLRLLLRILAVSGALRKLPTGVHPNMQVLYNSRTPADYQCPMFRSCDELYGFRQPVEPFTIGQLDTNFGSMFLGVQSLLVPGSDLEALDETVEAGVVDQYAEICEKRKLNRTSMDTSLVESDLGLQDQSAILPMTTHVQEAPASAKKTTKTPPRKQAAEEMQHSADDGSTLTTSSDEAPPQAAASEPEKTSPEKPNKKGGKRKANAKAAAEPPKKRAVRGRGAKAQEPPSSAQESSDSTTASKCTPPHPLAVHQRRPRRALFTEQHPQSRRFILASPETEVTSN